MPIGRIKSFIIENRFFVFLLVLTILIYSNSLTNNFVSDDFGTLDKTVSFLKNPLAELRSPEAASPSFYLTFPINYLLLGPNSLIFHLTNLLLYLFVILTVYWYLRTIPKERNLITLIFTLHPIHTEAVSFISARSYLIYSIFFLLSLGFYKKWVENQERGGLLFSFFFAALAFSFSPFAIVLPIMLAVTSFISKKAKRNWPILLIFLLLGLAISISLYFKGSSRYQTSLENIYGTAIPKFSVNISRLENIPVALATYLNLTFLVESPAFSHQNSTNLYSALAIALIFLTLLLRLKFKNPERFRLCLYFLVFSLVTLLPSLNPLTFNPTVADRYFFLPSLGLLVVAFLVVDSARKPLVPDRVWLIFLIVFISLLSYKTYQRNFDWKNEKTLFLSNLRTDFRSPYAHLRLGFISEEEKTFDEAEFHFRMAAALVPDLFAANLELGKIYTLKKEYGKARTYLEKALRIKSDDPETNAYLNYLNQKDPQ